jgi:hypothetical protein
MIVSIGQRFAILIAAIIMIGGTFWIISDLAQPPEYGVVQQLGNVFTAPVEAQDFSR